MEQDKKFKCYQCGKTYKLKSILLLHSMKCNEINLENNDKEVSETKTQISPKQNQKMKDKEYSIIIENDSSKSYQCNRCEKKFNTQTHITQHHYNVHREMKFKCEKCDKSFPFKSLLKIHVGKCNGSLKERRPQTLRNKEYKIIEDENSRKIYQCMRCGKNFNYLQGIHQHFYNVHREKNFNCKQCKKSFPHRFNLKSHLKVCLDGQGTKCEKCDKSFLSRTNLEVHRWNCGKTKEFKCRICDTVFKSPYVVQVHFYQSHKEKKFKCETCSETFAVKKRLKSHEEKCGAKDGHNICNKCEKAFRTAKLLRTHTIQMHEEKKFKCELCNKLFPFNSTLNYHKKNSHEGLKTKTEGKMYQCQQCEKRFGNINLIRQHTYHVHREKKNKCEKCGRLYPFKSLLNSHLKVCNEVEKVQGKRQPNYRDTIKASKLKKDISKFNQDKNSRVPKQDDKSIDKTEVLSNEEAFDFGNIEINIDDDVLEIYA